MSWHRRNFFRGVFASYLAFTSFCSIEFYKEKNKNKSLFEKYDKKNKYIKTFSDNKTIGVVQIPITYHCNLNCAYCDHFASIAPKYQISVEDYKNDIEKLYKATNGNIATIWLLGGEPLLHENINDIIKITSSIFKDSVIALTTNGLLLDKISDDFYKVCTECKVAITVENYILNDENINIAKIHERLKKYNCNLYVSSPKYSFRKANLSKKKLYNAENKYEKCNCKQWPLYDRGVFYSCSIANGVEKFFNKKFPEHAIPFSESDVLDINKVNSIDEIIDFYYKPKKICTHCGNFETKEWKLSNLELQEWYKV